MDSTDSANAMKITQELVKARVQAHRRKAREDIDSKLKEIQRKAEMTSDHEPVHTMRPYGLFEDMEGHRVHIWDLIFGHVNDMKTIASLCEVCTMFSDLLEKKYKAARLPEVIVKCQERKIISLKYTRTEGSTWVKSLQSLRTLSKATKNSVDIQFNRGMLGQGYAPDKDDWFWVDNVPFYLFHPNYLAEAWKIPTLTLGAFDSEQKTLRRVLDHDARIDGFPMRALIFDECRGRDDQFLVDLAELGNEFEKCLKKIGWMITSFRYRPFENIVPNHYNNLKRWLVHLPNLEELMVDFARYPWETLDFDDEDVGPFPECKKLKRFAEGKHGFGYPFINEIFKANPTIEEVLEGRIPSTEFEMNNLNQALGTLKLAKFHCNFALTLPFVECGSHWTHMLTTFAHLDRYGSPPQEVIPSDKMFHFISKFKNLDRLTLLSLSIRDTGGYLNLRKLKSVYWKIHADFKSLDFLKPVENLMELNLDLISCPELQPKEEILQHLEAYHVPSLFPALKSVQVKTGWLGRYKKIWQP